MHVIKDGVAPNFDFNVGYQSEYLAHLYEI